MITNAHMAYMIIQYLRDQHQNRKLRFQFLKGFESLKVKCLFPNRNKILHMIWYKVCMQLDFWWEVDRAAKIIELSIPWMFKVCTFSRCTSLAFELFQNWLYFVKCFDIVFISLQILQAMRWRFCITICVIPSSIDDKRYMWSITFEVRLYSLLMIY